MSAMESSTDASIQPALSHFDLKCRITGQITQMRLARLRQRENEYEYED